MYPFQKINISAILLILIAFSCNAPNDNSEHCIPNGHYYSHLEKDTMYTPVKSELKYKEYLIYPDVMMVIDYQGAEFISIRSSHDSLFAYYPSGNLDEYKYSCDEDTLVLSSTIDLNEKKLVLIQRVNKPFEEMYELVHRVPYVKRRDSILNQFFEKHE